MPFIREVVSDRDWVRNTIYNLVLEYEAKSLEKSHLETWMLLHVLVFY
ncbi:7319_t:CDS:2 [Funneliformis mosseae]|uniref:7319_t:CDS:1 n=1 Tax=Funneliformis mosseae TaxID=27381 RepID=A0A9N9FIX7_FUNMO|nr:7319_t:CDS:2 [Funneliformis mosseae]